MGGLIMVGKWYKFIDNEGGKNFTKNKWYKCIGNPHNKEAFIGNDNEKDGFYPFNPSYFDLSNPMNYNPDEVKEEVKVVQPKFKADTITIIILQDGSYQTTSTLEYTKMIKHIKEVAYLGDKQINEET
jgi:hypothetical protein